MPYTLTKFQKNSSEEGFYHLATFLWNARRSYNDIYYSRSQSRDFEARKAKIKEIQQTLNAPFDEERIKVDLFDQYYNMREVIEKDMSIVEIAKQAMEELSIQPIIEPVRGGTDGSKFLI